MLVTHGVTYLPHADVIVVMKDGEISEMGSYTELIHHNGPFAEFITNYLTEEQNDKDPDGWYIYLFRPTLLIGFIDSHFRRYTNMITFSC